ncbi:MAG TPA: hypothetical protein VG013_02060, partial [Gemmataceae bacterium]|nr:hypothetical protein [Gemmataceae bacterium]
MGKELFKTVPFGLPLEPTPEPFGPRRHGAALRRYGMTRWADMFTARQLLALGTFVRHTRAIKAEMQVEGYPLVWIEAVTAYLALAIDRIVDRGSMVCHWDMGYEKISNTFAGFRFSMSWDFAETNVVGLSTGSYDGQLEWIAQ